MASKIWPPGVTQRDIWDWRIFSLMSESNIHLLDSLQYVFMA